MTARLLTLLLVGAGLSACSVQDVRQQAENIRIRAEGIGAAAEAEASDRLLADTGGTAYREGQLQDSLQIPEPLEAEKAAAAGDDGALEPRAPPPQQPIYVIVPAN